MMMSASVAYVGLALWLADHGIGPERIGPINALPLIIVVLLSVSVGRLADRASDWRGASVACSAVAAAASAALFFVHTFWSIAIVRRAAVHGFAPLHPDLHRPPRSEANRRPTMTTRRR